ncbi:MAG: ABC transporter ATP-binding protein, partial [Acidimicrobiia bacterium]|nr:ABC transporter ATP-binding protein [Acidimicrobiia bacterium]
GAGKTTLLRMTTGLLRPDSGHVSVAGRDVWSDPAAAKAIFGVVPDQPGMFPKLTGKELLEFNGLLRGLDPSVTADRADELLGLLGLASDADTLVADYSLGMTKKVAIAAALLHNPRVVFLDEPFAGVDPVSRQVVEAILGRHVVAGGTVVFSDHAMDVVERLCSALLIMDHGRLLAVGPVAEITGGRRLQDVFVDLVGGGPLGEGGLTWLGSSSD